MTFEGVGANPLATPVHAKTYANPVINFSLPDPTIIKGDDEYYYLYATESIKNVAYSSVKRLGELALCRYCFYRCYPSKLRT